jgi:hypothetical protein
MFIPFLKVFNAYDLQVYAFIRYIAHCLCDGDWMNDWLTYLPVEIADAAMIIGEWIENII